MFCRSNYYEVKGWDEKERKMEKGHVSFGGAMLKEGQNSNRGKYCVW